jgi:uncharacterized membrane protein
VKEPQSELQAGMRTISLLVSMVGLGLMLFGFVDMVIHGDSLSIPGATAWSPLLVRSATPATASLIAMSAGIVVLALLPILRILLSLAVYLRSRQVLNVVVALIVFVELLVSVRTGG